MYKAIIKLRSVVLVYLTHKMALPLLKIIRRPEVFAYTRKELQVFADHILGKDVIIFIVHKQLELLPYFARHDIQHILLGYYTTDEG